MARGSRLIVPGHTRRDFVRQAAVAGAALALPLPLPLPRARTDEPLRVGVVLPRTGPLGAEGESAARGAELGFAEASQLAELLGRRLELIVSTASDAKETAGEARRLAEREGAGIILGGVGPGAAGALADASGEARFIFLNVGCAADALRSLCRPLTFHVEASFAMYADAVAAWAVPAGLRRWQLAAAGADDPACGRAARAVTARGGEVAGISHLRGESDATRSLAEARRSGADLLALCVEGPAREAALAAWVSERPGFEVAVLPGGTRRLAGLKAGARAGVWPTLWHHRLFRYGAEQLDARFRERYGEPLDDRAWAGWMAVKAAVEAALRGGAAESTVLAERLAGRRAQFDGHKGRQLTFRPWDHQLRQPVYLVRGRPDRDAPGHFEPLAELPEGEPGGALSSAEFLDRLGETSAEEPCARPAG